MAVKIRVLDAANRTMQRLGFLKLLCAIVNETETSNLASLGRRLIERVTRRVRLSLPVGEDLRNYVRCRLTDGIYRDLRKAVLEGGSQNRAVALELQDIYLSDSSLPSRTGKLVEADWRSFPYLGTSLSVIRKGTYSPLTRSLVLLAVTPKSEMEAFQEIKDNINPMKISDDQALVVLYCMIDNDAEAIFPLFRELLDLNQIFDDRTAGTLLPNVFRQIVRAHSNRSLNIEERDRLSLLNKSAESIDKWKGKTYTGGGARQQTITVRLEPYCDLGFFTKPDRDRYSYQTTKALKILLERWGSLSETDAFLQERFFRTFASCRKMKVYPATDNQAQAALFQAGETLKSTLGYSPITDVSLLAGIRLLTEKKRILELARSLELLKAWQKQDSSFVRFTVDRMGAMAFVKFLKPTPGG